MARTCPSCKSLNARRSSVRASEITLRHIFLSPYRCRECRARFWVLSKNTYYFSIVIGLAMVMGAIVWWSVGAGLDAARSDAAQAKAVLPAPADLIKRAEANDAIAELELSHIYGNGHDVAKSAAQEFTWVQRSAQHGNLQAQYELGIALRDGRGTIQDYEAARKWVQLAAEGGIGQAQYELGIMYRSGRGVTPDNLKSYVWLNLAAAQEVLGAAAARDIALARLSPAELVEAQAEARRLSEIYIPKAAPTQ
jgi:hypothetical protein